jgi:hypothetical protein
MSEEPGRDVAIFTEALRLPVEQRPAFLGRACAGDENLRREVEALLSAHERVGNFLEKPPLETGSEAPTEKEPEGPGGNNGGANDE